ncbi:MAG: ATP-binding cassette domain-containing protein [Candidatus Omnitrophota bacterium]|nr:ATP-binding cassette domain-containing protein [Candidatus Omnitrophota bacterium]
MKVVIFDNVSEKYRVKFTIGGKEAWEDICALQDASFSVEEGQAVAIIGENGAGKSTILKLIAGTFNADRGRVFVKGKVAALLELGAGFSDEFTGRENIFLNASLFGLSNEEINNKLKDIIVFSGIGRFIDAQLKSYSQGMFVRLAFSVAVHMDPDILLIDDTLAVGDGDFQRKCINKVIELQEAGKTIIFVTHDMNMARRLCKKGIVLREGKIVKEGPIENIISYYMETWGDKKGIAVIQKGDMEVVFNNGRFILRWEDKVITKDQGGYISFFLFGHRFNSPTADWQVEISEDQRIIAKGGWFNVPVTLSLDIRFLDDNQLQLSAVLVNNDNVEVDDLQVELLFREDYKEWFSSEHEGVFADHFFHEKECELVYNDPLDKLSGISPGNIENRNDSLPIVIIDAFGQAAESLCQILNSGIDIAARIIRLKMPKLRKGQSQGNGEEYCLAMKIKIIASNMRVELEKYMSIAQENIAQQRQLLRNRKKAAQEERLIFEDSRFSLCVSQNNFVHLYYNDRKLTRDPGITASLLIGKEWQDSVATQAWVEKISEKQIRIHNILWKKLPIIQTWTFSIKEQEVVNLMIKMEMPSFIKISELKVSIFLSNDYLKWFTGHEAGNFTKDFDILLWKEVVPKNEKIKAIGVVSADLPAVILDLSGNSRYTPCLYNSDQSFSAHVLQAESCGKEYQKGEIEYFEGNIRVTENRAAINNMNKNLTIYSAEQAESIFDKEYVFGEALYILDDDVIFNETAVSPNVYRDTLNEIKRMYDKKTIGIGVTRRNFFKLDKIVRFCAEIFNKNISSNRILFNLCTTESIYVNFIEYIKKIKLSADTLGVKLVLKDEELIELLETVSEQFISSNNRDVLRILGIICGHAFVGPREIIIDSYHNCNSNCVHCWFHNPKTAHSEDSLGMKLDIDLFKMLVDDAQKLSVERIIFDGQGEPLLDQRFFEMLEYTVAKNIGVFFSTNGILFFGEIFKKILLDLEVEGITCSLPAATSETYILINPKQPQSTFYKIVENMKFLVSMRNNGRMTKPIVTMNHVIHALNCHEMMQMAMLDAQIGADKVEFYLIRKMDENIGYLKPSFKQFEEIKKTFDDVKDFLGAKNIVLNTDMDFQLAHYDDSAVLPNIGNVVNNNCLMGWFRTEVFANADVSICQAEAINNLSKASLKEIWNSGKYHYYRNKNKYIGKGYVNTGVKLFSKNCRGCAMATLGSWKENLFKEYGLDKFL